MHRKDYNILIIEDEFINSEFLKQVLLKFGFQTIYIVTNAQDALTIVANKKIHFAFVDINISGPIDGIMCSKMMNQKYELPIVYTTAYSDSTTISEASETNIYGYLIKPFDSKDVEVICNIVLKIAFKRENSIEEKNIVHICQDYKFDLDTKTFTIDNNVIKLSKNELKLLDVLCKNINQCVPYAMIKDYVWENKTIADSTMRDTISRLRRKANDIDIESFSGVGYCLKKA